MADLMTNILPWAAANALLDAIQKQLGLIPELAFFEDLSKGVRNEANLCPLAVFGSLVYDTRVEVNSEEIEVEVWQDGVVSKMVDVRGTTVERFVKEFDAGRWPQYEEQYPTYNDYSEGEWA